MLIRKLITFLVMLCVLCASTANIAAAVLDRDAAMASLQDSPADCHGIKPDADHAFLHDSAQNHKTKASHACCASILGIVSRAGDLPSLPGSDVFASFSPSLRLIVRIEGIYRPPPRNS